MDEETVLLSEMLFNEKMSRNRQFDLYQAPEMKRLHRLVKILRKLHRELMQPETEHWIEHDENAGKVRLYVRSNPLRILRTVFLTQAQWELLQDPRWSKFSSKKSSSLR